MNPLHFIWIIPAAASFGFLICAVLAVSKERSESHVH